jgi:predicted RNA binding protein with dsRBD fold (UPF0201 family)
MTSIKIKAIVQQTEDPEKVKKAITNLFGDISLNHDRDDSIITGKIDAIEGLHNFRSRIAQDRIKTTLANTLTRWTKEDYLSFGLNRQAAYAGHVSLNLTNEDPMGPIQVQIRGDIIQTIDFLCK